MSVLDATQGSPSRTRIAPAITVDHRRSRWKPETTATGSSAVSCTGRRPSSASATSRPSPPITKTGAPSGRSSASSRAAAWAEVTTSPSSTSMPSSRRWAATVSGVREALFVTYARCSPAARASARCPGAPGTASGPTYTTPSRSSMATS